MEDHVPRHAQMGAWVLINDRWYQSPMFGIRWTAAGLLEAQKTFRRLKAYRQLPILRNALQEHLRKVQADSAIETIMKAA